MIRRLLIAVLVGLLLMALGAGLAARWAWQEIHRPLAIPEGSEAPVVDIEPGTSVRAILERLEAEGILADALLARLYLVHRLDDPPLRAGEYRFEGPLDTPAVLDRLIRGQVETYPLTLIEGLTYLEVAEAIADAGFGDRATLLAEVSRSELVADLDPEAENLEGYLYPDTYHFARGTSERVIVETLVTTFRRRYEAEVAPVWTPSADFTLRDLVTVASIVEKETQAPEERGLVASVYTNRLRIGMGLYADPTIIYAKKLDGTWDGNLRRPDLAMDSPYNTYVVAGLPPSPICSPSVASLLATAMPAESKYLYFVSRNDGTHVFAESKAEHDRNVYRWQKLYWRERWARERAERQKQDG
ncbi:MAG: endolytic transglycosylase MltG [Holophagales bacterium]|nr:endolytic transglycosylase MltG [Holophagales bacterium]